MPDYVVITPVRNEGRHLPQTIASMAAQPVPPKRWVIVNDGSTDDTGAIIAAAVQRHPWIQSVTRPDRGFRKSGGGVVEAFYDGYELLRDVPWDFLAKLDGDLAFDADFFPGCFARFEQEPRLGIGGGTICEQVDGRLVAEKTGDPRFHVRGATKIYRRQCWEEIGGLVRAPGWDTVDELKANMLGWTTRTFPELKLHQLKFTGSADGLWRGWVKNGRANYVTGYHPLFMLAKCARRTLRRPYLVGAAGLAWGYLSGYWQSATPCVDDRRLIRYVRDQQLRKLTFRPSLWD